MKIPFTKSEVNEAQKISVKVEMIDVFYPSKGSTKSHELKEFINEAFKASEENPILIDKFIDSAMEVDVDAISDGKDVYVAGIMQHIEEAGIHSGDSSCVVPPYNLSIQARDEIISYTNLLAKKLNTDVISAQTVLGATPADTDELLVSDAGVLKRVDYSHLKVSNSKLFYAYLNFQ